MQGLTPLVGCVSPGKTRGEALANIRDAIEGILELRRKRGLPIVSWIEELPAGSSSGLRGSGSSYLLHCPC
ncbi:MAG TPA: hypothetical protein DCY61_01835 [Dehalococcoidia bacterium]|nr:hypothetical protein [Dehalococcoidia bacterium]